VTKRQRPRQQPLVSESRAMQGARQLFINAVNEVVPEAARTLKADVLPAYRAIPNYLKKKCDRGPVIVDYPDGKRAFVQQPNIVYVRLLEEYARHSRLARELRDALNKWAAHYRLQDEWLVDSALWTLYLWDCYNDATGEFLWMGKVRWNGLKLLQETESSPFREEELRFPSLPDVWDPTLQTWGAFERTSESWFRWALKDYKSRISALATAKGLERPVEVRNNEHYTWLVRYQCTGDKIISVALDFDENESTVQQGILRAAAAIKLQRRRKRRT
jgi:hypothetical protein